MDVTVAKVFQEVSRIHHDKPAIKFKKGDSYESVTFSELYGLVRELGTGLRSLGIAREDKVGIISDNRPEWIRSDLACVCIGAVDVPRGSDSSAREIEYILGHSDAVAAFVEDAAQLEKVAALRSRLPALRFLIVMDPSFDAPSPEEVYRLTDVAAKGRALLEQGDQGFEQALKAVRDKDLATIIYTSGTTGEPKGVMLSHRNLMQNIEVVPGWIGINEQDRFLSILPPWHIFERMVEYVVITCGASLAYTSIRTFAADMGLEKPTYIASVPRIWEGIYSKVMANMAKQPEKRQKIFHALVNLSKKYVRAMKVLQGRDTLYEPEPAFPRAVKVTRSLLTVILLFPLYAFAQKKFAAIRERTGGCLKAAISGGGALPPYVDEFFSAVGITLLEGYGLTETSPLLASRTFDRLVLGTVGLPTPGTEIKIVDEQGETLPQGEKGLVKCRGAQVMEGYYKKPEETRKVIDDEGWFDTGDLGRMTIRGELSLTGRAKETIVLLGGENVEPTPIEDSITESAYILQTMVVGQDKKTLGALVVPDFDALGKSVGLEGLSPAEICAREEASSFLRDEIRTLVSTAKGFKAFEKITSIRLLEQEFAVGEELTHTMKKKRNVIAEKYKGLIGEMYL
jgi:long-chain acyl-CoA synthetase